MNGEKELGYDEELAKEIENDELSAGLDPEAKGRFPNNEDSSEDCLNDKSLVFEKSAACFGNGFYLGPKLGDKYELFSS